VNQVWSPSNRFLQNPPRQEQIKDNLMPGRPHFVVGTPGGRPGANDVQTRPITSEIIGSDAHLLPAGLKGAGLLQNTHVTTVVEKEGCWRDHQDAAGVIHSGIIRPLTVDWTASQALFIRGLQCNELRVGIGCDRLAMVLANQCDGPDGGSSLLGQGCPPCGVIASHDKRSPQAS